MMKSEALMSQPLNGSVHSWVVSLVGYYKCQDHTCYEFFTTKPVTRGLYSMGVPCADITFFDVCLSLCAV